jgi:hypothetical protein
MREVFFKNQVTTGLFRIISVYLMVIVKNLMKKRHLHSAARIAALLFVLVAASEVLSTFFPQFRGPQLVTTICVAFIAPFLIIYSSTRSRPHKTGNALLTLFFCNGAFAVLVCPHLSSLGTRD